MYDKGMKFDSALSVVLRIGKWHRPHFNISFRAGFALHLSLGFLCFLILPADVEEIMMEGLNVRAGKVLMENIQKAMEQVRHGGGAMGMPSFGLGGVEMGEMPGLPDNLFEDIWAKRGRGPKPN